MVMRMTTAMFKPTKIMITMMMMMTVVLMMTMVQPSSTSSSSCSLESHSLKPELRNRPPTRNPKIWGLGNRLQVVFSAFESFSLRVDPSEVRGEPMPLPRRRRRRFLLAQVFGELLQRVCSLPVLCLSWFCSYCKPCPMCLCE